MAHASLKETLRGLLLEGRLEEAAALAERRKRVLGSLVALTFDREVGVVWRAIEAMGLGVERLGRTHPEYVKEHMRRLYWLITEESGGIFWRAPECLAECAARRPDLLGDFVPIAFHLVESLEPEDLEHFRAGALWAVGRLAEVVTREEVEGVVPLMLDALGDPDPQVRGTAAWSLGRVGAGGSLERRPELFADAGEVLFYRDREVRTVTVADLAREAATRPL